MANFKHINTFITKSNCNFDLSEGAENFTGSASIAGQVGVPRSPDKNPRVRCELTFTFGSETKVLNVQVTTVSIFEISNYEGDDLRSSEFNDYCYQLALDKLNEKVSKLIEIHTGRPITLPSMYDYSKGESNDNI